VTGRIDGLKAVKEVDAKISDVDARIDRHAASMAAAVTAHDQQVAEWRERVSAGFGDGTVSDEPQPEKPEALRLAGDHLARLRREREGLQRERQKVIVAHGEEVLELVSRDVAKALTKAAPLLAELDQHLKAVSRAQQDVMLVIDAANTVNRVNRGVLKTEAPTRVDVSLLAEAVSDGIDPIESEREQALRVLGLKIATPLSGASESGWRSDEDLAADRQRRDDALASQAQQLLGSQAPRPLGYRSGLR